MTQQLHESLSAIMDGEGNELELRRVLKTLDESPELGDVWRRYHLMRSALRRERDIVVDMDIASGVMAAIEQEDVAVSETVIASAAEQSAAAQRPKRRSLSLMGGAAVAAAVSLMVVSGVQFYRGHDSAALPDAASLQVNNAALDNAAQQLVANGSDSLGQLGVFGQGNQAMAASYSDFSHAASSDLTPVSWNADASTVKAHNRRYHGQDNAQSSDDSARFHFERQLRP